MRLPLIIAAILCSLLLQPTADAAPPAAKKSIGNRHAGLSIRVEGGGWGADSAAQIETVLYAVADELLTRLPKKLAASVVVTHTDSNPIALYDRGPKGEYLVHLHANNGRWHLYVYEFAHEFTHILSNYEENVGAEVQRYNQWFEETLCETASLYTLEHLAATWEHSPPAPEWSEQAGRLRRFFDLLVAERHRQLPANTPLGAWLRDNEERLRRDPYQRDKNDLVARMLLPLFERYPASWDALSYLNLDPADARDSLAEYLHHWYDNAPAEHKVFIADVLRFFDAGEIVPTTLAGAPAAASALR